MYSCKLGLCRCQRPALLSVSYFAVVDGLIVNCDNKEGRAKMGAAFLNLSGGASWLKQESRKRVLASSRSMGSLMMVYPITTIYVPAVRSETGANVLTLPPRRSWLPEHKSLVSIVRTHTPGDF